MNTDIVNKLRMYAEDLHSAGGFNGYASAMSLAADEIVKLREYAEIIEADLVATIDQRDDIIRMAREHLVKSEYTEFGWQDCYRHEFDDDELVRFAALVAAAEREACARLCEEHKALRLSEIIRARGGAE